MSDYWYLSSGSHASHMSASIRGFLHVLLPLRHIDCIYPPPWDFLGGHLVQGMSFSYGPASCICCRILIFCPSPHKALSLLVLGLPAFIFLHEAPRPTNGLPFAPLSSVEPPLEFQHASSQPPAIVSARPSPALAFSYGVKATRFSLNSDTHFS